MIFYLIVFLSALLLVSNKGRAGESSRAYWVGVCILFLVSAFRFDVGQDFLQFYTLEVPDISEITFWPSQRKEGCDFNRFGIAVKLLYLLSDAVGCRQIVFIVTSAVIYFGVGYFVSAYSRSPSLSWAYFIGFMAVQSYNMIWQMSAMVIVLLAYGCVLDKRPLAFVAVVLCATSFHTSAIIALLIYPVYYRVPVKYLCISAVGVFLVSDLFVDMLDRIGFYASYLDEMDKYPGGNRLKWIYPILVCGMALIGSKGGVWAQAKNTRLLSIVLVGIVPPFVFGPHLGNRVGFYFTQFFLLLCPECLGDHVMLKRVFAALFCAFFFMTVFLSQRSDALVDTHVPYRCVLWTDTEYLRER